MPTLTPNYLVGKAVAVSLGGTLAFCKGGSSDRQAMSIKVTNSRSGGFRQVKAGTLQADFNFELVYNGDSPPAIVEGTEITVIIDSVGYEASESIANPATTPFGRLITAQALVTSVKDAWQVEADYGVTITAESTGAYTCVDTATGATPTS